MEEAKGEPPDGGWGWVIVFASFVGFFISTGNVHSFSVLYVAFLDAFGESKAVTAWIGGIFTLVLTFSTSYGVALAKRFGHRKTVMAAGVLASVGILTSGFTTNVYQLYFTFGVLSGVGMGLAYVSCFEIVSIYFKKRFPIAIGLAMAGSGAGQFVLSIVTQLMVDWYGWRGMLLIMSAFTSHLCLAGALMRPLKTSQPSQIYESSDKIVKTSETESGCVNTIHGIEDKDLKLIGDESAESAFMIKVESKTVPQKPSRTRSRRLKSYLLTIYDFTLFKEPVYIILCIISLGQVFGTISTTVHLVRRARDFGISDNIGAYIPAVMGLAQLVGRPSFGALGSIRSLNPSIPYAVAMFVCASSLIISTYTRTFTAQIVLLSIYGICTGGFAVYKTVVLKHFLGNERIGQALSIQLHVQGMASLFIGPLGGWMRDSSGVYDGFYWLSGVWLLLASVLAVSLPVVKRSSTHWCHKGNTEAQNNVTSSISEKLIIQYTTSV
ncbi:monocarboxylate transporter 13-like isoform X1 [Ptychodera flava]|uniref:monocarboxylate transporter 13-like isoform X1 n=1 Tax=Ptychodera flava TaxID=63121 RepID=UPI003969E04E